MASKIDTTQVEQEIAHEAYRRAKCSPDTSGTRDKPLVVGASGPIRVSTFVDQLLAEP